LLRDLTIKNQKRGGLAKAQEDVASFTGVTIIETLIAPGEWYATSLKMIDSSWWCIKLSV